ncbi:MAG: 5'-3' exonuclease [Malacoplasma sp.]|nr:5'-3' exonuclease [Malacoplasma sp.]
MAKKAFAIDGNCFMYRCFYGTLNQLAYYEKNNLQPLNAFNLFVQQVLRMINNGEYEYGVIAFDLSKHTFRTDKYEKYKAGRNPMPDPMRSQLPLIKDAVDHLGIYRGERENYEADDVIGSFSRIMNLNNIPVDIYTSDRDMLQLVTPLTTVRMLKNGGIFDDFTYENFSQKFMGLTPEQITDYKGIAGDSSDNLPGVVGIGPKTAAQLLREYKHLENIYDNIDKLSSAKQKEKFINCKQQAIDCKELATIFCNLFEEVDANMFIIKPIDKEYLIEVAKKHNLNKLFELLNK